MSNKPNKNKNHFSEYRIKRQAENERTEELLVYLIENDLLMDFDSLTQIIDCFPTDVPNLIKKLQDSNGIDNDEVIETLEIHYDIDYCDGCGVVLDDGYCYNDSCIDKQDECLEEEEDA